MRTQKRKAPDLHIGEARGSKLCVKIKAGIFFEKRLRHLEQGHQCWTGPLHLGVYDREGVYLSACRTSIHGCCLQMSERVCEHVPTMRSTSISAMVMTPPGRSAFATLLSTARVASVHLSIYASPCACMGEEGESGEEKEGAESPQGGRADGLNIRR